MPFKIAVKTRIYCELHTEVNFETTYETPGNAHTISGAHIDLQGIDDGAVEGPAQEGARASTGSLHSEAQSIVLVLHMQLGCSAP